MRRSAPGLRGLLVLAAAGCHAAALPACNQLWGIDDLRFDGAAGASAGGAGSGKCVDTAKDAANCGGCGQDTDCAAGEVCVSGKCAVTCSAGRTECAGKCVNTKVDPANCGGCGQVCAQGAVCILGKCLGCGAGQTDCAGKCVDTAKDAANCGSCGSACAQGQMCVSGQCVPS